MIIAPIVPQHRINAPCCGNFKYILWKFSWKSTLHFFTNTVTANGSLELAHTVDLTKQTIISVALWIHLGSDSDPPPSAMV